MGREGSTSVHLIDRTTGNILNIDTTISGISTHKELNIDVGEGQGIANLVLNVSGNLVDTPFTFNPPNINMEIDDVITVDTMGGDEVRLHGINFGTGHDYTIVIDDNNDPGGVSVNGDVFPISYNEFSVESILNFTHHYISFSSPEGQNKRNEDLSLSVTVAGQTSPSVKFNFASPVLTKLSMCFADALKVVFIYDCQGEYEPLGSDCDTLALLGGCGLSTSGGYTLSVIGKHFGKVDSNAQRVFFGDVELKDTDFAVLKSHRNSCSNSSGCWY